MNVRSFKFLTCAEASRSSHSRNACSRYLAVMKASLMAEESPELGFWCVKGIEGSHLELDLVLPWHLRNCGVTREAPWPLMRVAQEEGGSGSVRAIRTMTSVKSNESR